MPTQDALGLVLLHDGIITQAQLYQALQLQRQTNRLLSTCLVSLGFIAPDILLATQSRLLELPVMPPGLLKEAAPEAIARVSQELCLRLRIVPYSWDGEVLGVALADERVIDLLTEVAQQAQAAVGAYLALESDIDAMLKQLFGRNRPDESSVPPVVPKIFRGPPPAAPPRPAPTPVAIAAAPAAPAPPAPSGATPQPLERTSFYDAIAHVYEMPTLEGVGACIGSALLNYFCRVLVFRLEGQHLHLSSFAGADWVQPTVPMAAIPHVNNTWESQRFVYGSSAQEPRGLEICAAAGIAPAPTCLIAVPGDKKPPDLLIYADNGPSPDLYEDIHDIQLLLKESDTALSLLGQ